jgi:4-amino-4-deoxy-L-arabinose transferase-like glycosyltransferase
MPSRRSRHPAEGGERGRIIPVLWALMPLLSCTVLTPVPFAHAAIRLRDGKLWRITVAYALLWLPLAILNTVANSTGSEGGSGVTAFLLFVLAGVATVHALRLRRRVFAPPAPATEP